MSPLIVVLFGLIALAYSLPVSFVDRTESIISQPVNANITVSWFNQKVDHFTYTNGDYFKQRILSSSDHWGGEGSPIFFYAGNEGDIFSFSNNTGWMWERAEQFKAMVVFAEHRYYGATMPYGNESFSGLEKLGFLSSSQALADYAAILQDLKLRNSDTKDSPVIVFGGSYGGMLATWIRIKYPHLVEGALAASAPIWQFPGIYDCEAYFRTVSDDLKGYSDACAQTVNNSWPAVRRIAETKEGRQWLQDEFKICEDLSTDQAIDDFLVWLSGTYESLAMADYPNPATFLAPLPAYPMKEVCKKLTDPSLDDKELLAEIYTGISVFYNYTGTTDCNSIGLGDDGTGWDFQFCSEMVMPVCSDNVNDVFPVNPWNFTKYANNCYRKWKVWPEPLKAEMLFGGKNISTLSNIIFSNGDRDPWGPGGVHTQVSPNVELIRVPHGCHHEDLRPTGPNDPQSLTDVRNQEAAIITDWIKKYYERLGRVPKSMLDFY